jgi:hypothetical protein
MHVTVPLNSCPKPLDPPEVVSVPVATPALSVAFTDAWLWELLGEKPSLPEPSIVAVGGDARAGAAQQHAIAQTASPTAGSRPFRT